jgi:hypothetical protein
LCDIASVRSSFHILRCHIHLGRYRQRRVFSSCFALPDSFSTVPRASGPVFLFCAPELVFDGTEGVGSRFHVLRSRTRFRRYRGCRVPFSFFALPDSFLTIPWTSGPICLFGAPGPVLGDTESVGSSFNVLGCRIRLDRYRAHLVSFSCFALTYTFSTVPRASGPVFMFCAPALIFDVTEDVGSRFHVLRSRTRFRRYRGRRVLFSCFALPDSFSMIPRASGPIFIFYAPGLIFSNTEGVGSRPHVFRS